MINHEYEPLCSCISCRAERGRQSVGPIDKTGPRRPNSAGDPVRMTFEGTVCQGDIELEQGHIGFWGFDAVAGLEGTKVRVTVEPTGDPAPVRWPDTEGEPFVELARDAAEIVRAVIDACALPLGVEESKLAKRVDAAPLEARIVALVRGYVEYARANPTRPLP